MGSELAAFGTHPLEIPLLQIPALQIYGPEAYSPMWLLLAVVLAIVLVAWPILAWLIIREKKAEPVPPPAPADPDRARHDAMRGIEGIAAEHASGRLSHREATQALSRIVRTFVAGTGFPGVEKMDLTQLKDQLNQRHQLTPVARYVEVLYPPSFGPDEVDAATVEQSLDQARELVGRWVVPPSAPSQEGHPTQGSGQPTPAEQGRGPRR